MPLRAVLFDLWGTLIVDDPESSARRSRLRTERVQAALANAGHYFGLEDVLKAFELAERALARIHATESDLSARGRTVLYLQHLDESLPDKLDDDGWQLFDDVVLTPALKHKPLLLPASERGLAAVKKRGLATVLISNAGTTPGFVLRRLLDDFGLLKHLDVTVFSDEVELSKPSPAIFAHALDEIGVARDEAVFVGDDPLLDVFGGMRAGLRVVQIGDSPVDGHQPHARIGTLDELAAVIDGL